MYANIPKIDTINIICNILGCNPEIIMNFQKEILHILQRAMEETYFQFDQQYYKQTDGLVMGAPSSLRSLHLRRKYTYVYERYIICVVRHVHFYVPVTVVMN
jgi:hypothetical protein